MKNNDKSLKELFEAMGEQMNFITNTINKTMPNKFNSLPEAEDERISICCSALLNDFNFCADCKEASSPVEDDKEVREMEQESVERLNSEKKYA